MKISECISAAATAFGMSPSDITRPDRAHRVSHPRQAAMWLARASGFSFQRIANGVGLADHSTVVHGVRAAERRADADEEYGDRLQTAWILLGVAE